MPKYHFLLDKNYDDSFELIEVLFVKGFSSSTNLFLWCCDCIMFMARYFGTSYAMMNLILFVFLQPAISITLLFLYLREKNKNRLAAR
jgi:hypothetical protein